MQTICWQRCRCQFLTKTESDQAASKRANYSIWIRLEQVYVVLAATKLKTSWTFVACNCVGDERFVTSNACVRGAESSATSWSSGCAMHRVDVDRKTICGFDGCQQTSCTGMRWQVGICCGSRCSATQQYQGQQDCQDLQGHCL